LINSFKLCKKIFCTTADDAYNNGTIAAHLATLIPCNPSQCMLGNMAHVINISSSVLRISSLTFYLKWSPQKLAFFQGIGKDVLGKKLVMIEKPDIILSSMSSVQKMRQQLNICCHPKSGSRLRSSVLETTPLYILLIERVHEDRLFHPFLKLVYLSSMLLNAGGESGGLEVTQRGA
ncbi:uncharacterized protein VP01_3268g1, partial [Puccinia sorghi]